MHYKSKRTKRQMGFKTDMVHCTQQTNPIHPCSSDLPARAASFFEWFHAGLITDSER